LTRTRGPRNLRGGSIPRPPGNGVAAQPRPTAAARSRAARGTAPARASRRAARPAPDAPTAVDMSPTRDIARVSRETRREMPGPIDPDDLLIHAHRDHHPVQVAAEYVANRVVEFTHNERGASRALKLLNSVGAAAAGVAGLFGTEEIEKKARRVMGVQGSDHFYRFREATHLSDREVRTRVEKLQKDARTLLRARGRNPRLNVLLTGATGFLGKELLAQAADDRRIAQLVAVVRPETIRDPKTREVVKVLSPQERGTLLLKRLHITGARARKFRFVEGDIEKPDLGIDAAELARLRRTTTHVIHCAASVSFDDTYENSFRANVLGCRNALSFSLALQRAPETSFIQHIAIETSYIHGRKKSSIAQESELEFPRHFYNNFYELTKAFASMETDRAMIEQGLRVAQLLPSIVIGDSRTGNNRGDTKVVNAPINAFGRAKDTVQPGGGPVAALRARVVWMMASGFPGHPSAELNLVPVDRVVGGILAALTVPESIGTRIHLATDNRIRSADIVRITHEELGVDVRLIDPTLYRNVMLPMMRAVLIRANQPKLANALEKLSTIFGSYGEWGQPIHEIGNDVRLLGLPLRRPDTLQAFRMLCRHNKYVQGFGKVRDADEVSRREKLWDTAIDEIERKTGHQVGQIPAEEFRRVLADELDLATFDLR
jgi:nucleoside-diphosphate-sugar epimerase